MKLIFDFLPLFLFFLTYKIASAHAPEAAMLATQWLGLLVSGGVVGSSEGPVLLATIIAMAATLIQVVWMRLSRRKIDLMLWISLVTIIVIGGATIWYHNETFIKWKPSVVLWTMGLIFLISQTCFQRNLLRSTLGGELELSETVWKRLNLVWVAYFALMGALNLWVAYSFSTDEWASFHTFGSSGLSIAFLFAQGIYISKYRQPEALDWPVR